MKKLIPVLFILIAFAGLTVPASADVLDPLDNSSAPVGTTVLVSYFGYMHWPEYEDQNGHVDDIGTNISYAAFRPVYFAGKVFGKTWGINGLIPFQHVSIDDAESQSGVGDLVVGPFIFLYENFQTQTFLSFWEFAYTPTGSDDVSNDSWWFQHQLAFGWYPGPWSVDVCLNYWQKDEDSDGNDVSDAFELEGVVAYGVTDKLRIGVQAAWWKDFDDIKDPGGATLSGTQGENLKLGINLGYALQENLILNLRYMHDVDSEAYTKGSWTYLRLTYIF
jgi:hypothetical protein